MHRSFLKIPPSQPSGSSQNPNTSGAFNATSSSGTPYDLAFQAYVLAGEGLKLRRCIVAHINSGFLRDGAIDPHKFFVLQDVTGQVSAMSRDVESRLDDMFSTIRLRRHPDIAIGRHCDGPYPCPLHDLCWGHLPESD